MLKRIMTDFAEQTGLLPPAASQRRYLWTDAFAVCNFLELFRRTGDDHFRSLALHLVDQVHQQLGRHRPDDRRRGWISGLPELEGRRHPTAGGLRIGKKINERSASEPFDEDREWDRDGQYYHYLTKWMHALNAVALATGQPQYGTWARELAQTAHARFVVPVPAPKPKSIYWKMSIDLSRPLVPFMGHHDPLDGWITYHTLQANAAGRPPDLAGELAELEIICKGRNWMTDDPLGIGGLLCDAYRLAQLIAKGHLQRLDLLQEMLHAARAGLEAYAARGPGRLPAEYRLAFRELGLAIGMHAVERLLDLMARRAGVFSPNEKLQAHVVSLLHYRPLTESIEKFWLEDASQKSPIWAEHLDINRVMQATSLAPDGFLQSTA
jgi:hypothetical protein